MKRPPSKPTRRPATDQKSGFKPGRKPGRGPEHKTDRKFFKPQQKPESGLWLYGIHAVKAALANPKRFVRRAVVTERAAEEIGAKLLDRVKHDTTDMHGISKMLPEGAVHQGAAMLVEPLPRLELDAVLESARAAGARRHIVLIMDQVTDPHNAGAILRTAAAFGVTAVVVQDRHSPPEAGVMAKAASGALDIVPVVTVVNIARTLEDLGKKEFWRVALAGDGEQTLAAATDHAGDVALVMGSEGAGVRRLVRENCDVAAFVPIASAMESLNVSNAAAIALYELTRPPSP